MNKEEIKDLLDFLKEEDIRPELRILAATTVLKIYLNSLNKPSGLLVHRPYKGKE